jgi:hypothetical protein
MFAYFDLGQASSPHSVHRHDPLSKLIGLVRQQGDSDDPVFPQHGTDSPGELTPPGILDVLERAQPILDVEIAPQAEELRRPAARKREMGRTTDVMGAMAGTELWQTAFAVTGNEVVLLGRVFDSRARAPYL